MIYFYGKTLAEIFDYFHIDAKDRAYIERTLMSEGYTLAGICYAAARSEEKLLSFAGDTRLPSIFINEVRKISFKRNDPRWKTRKEKQNEALD